MRAVGALILAAGGSTRFGEAKQFLVFDGQALLRRVVVAAQEGGCAPIAAVVGQEWERAGAELAGTGAHLVHNREWERGIGTSIRCGIKYLVRDAPSLEGAILLACDQPYVNGEVISRLIGERKKSGKTIVASHYAGTLGIPAFFGASWFGALCSLDDESGAKSLLQSHHGDMAHIEFEGGAVDIDTPDEYASLTSHEYNRRG
ncbi:MAG: nucleotidyltransferase family protein [Chthoniobacterales bacterium]